MAILRGLIKFGKVVKMRKESSPPAMADTAQQTSTSPQSSMPNAAAGSGKPDKSRNLLVLAAIVVVLVIILAGLNLLNLFPQKSGKGKAEKIPAPPNEAIVLQCPVETEFCRSGSAVTYNGNPALAFNLPAGTKILSAAAILDFAQFIESPYTGQSPIGFYASHISEDQCQTLTYTVPQETVINKVDLLPLVAGVEMATASASLVKVDGQDANLILQQQQRPVATGADLTDYQKCAVANLDAGDFGDYQTIDDSSF